MKLPRGRLLDVGIAGLLLLAVLAAFWPILGHEFVFDDFALIVENVGTQGLDAARLRWMFSTTYLTTYMPLGWAAFGAVFEIGGLDPAAFHTANLAAHWLVTVALFAVTRRLFRLAGDVKPQAPAFAAALLFCVHPFQVNTVAWAIELPDMLSTCFFLIAIFLYLGSGERAASRWRMAAVFGLYAVSLLFRWRSLSLPLVLVALDYWPLKRLRARPGDMFDHARVGVWAEKAPFIVLAVAAASLTHMAKSRELYEASFAPVAAARALWVYPWALLWPKDYYTLYALHGEGNALGMPAWVALGLAALTSGVLWLRRRSWPALLIVWVTYAAAVLPPALSAQGGLVYIYPAYGYLGCIGFFMLAGTAARRASGFAAVCVLGLALIAGSRNESRHWADQISFWSRAIARDPGFSPGYGQLGAALLARGRYDEAFRSLSVRVAAEPGDEEAARQLARAASLRTRTP